MKRWLVVLFIAVLATSAGAVEIHGTKVAETVQVEGSDLLLNGAGVRTKVIFKVYVAALYLKDKKNTAESVLADAGAKRVSLFFLRELSAEKLANALDEGLTANNSAAELTALDAKLKEFRALISSGGAAKEGSQIVLDYVPGKGTQVLLNGTAKGVILGEDFNRALLKVWLGEHPVDDKLKKSLLGG